MFDTRSIKTFCSTPWLRLVFPGSLLVLTVVFCAAPRFHPEAVLGLRYHPVLDALFHGSYYFVVTLLLYRPLVRKMGRFVFFGSVLTLSLLLEGAQAWLPGRSFSLTDLFANALGITGATVLQSLRHCMNLSFSKSKYSS